MFCYFALNFQLILSNFGFRWLKLRDKPGKDKDKDRGELEVKVGFTVKGENELIKKEKHRSSLGQISHTASTLGRLSFYIHKNCKPEVTFPDDLNSHVL